jgi:hypothetical protein
MALRFSSEILHGEIDNRQPGRTTGILHLLGRPEPLTLDLAGNPWRDLAGHRLVFKNPAPAREASSLPAPHQTGRVGDISASRKVKVLDCPLEDLRSLRKQNLPVPFHWENSLYLEWFSVANGRVVIEATGFEISIDPEPAWTMTPEQEREQREANESAMQDFLEDCGNALASGLVELPATDDSDDEPQSRLEAEADSEAARMNLLNDRINARLLADESAFERYDEIWLEEREKLRIELEQKIAEVRLVLQQADQHPDLEDENENPRG